MIKWAPFFCIIVVHLSHFHSVAKAETMEGCVGIDFALWDAESDVLLSEIADGDDYCVDEAQFAVEVRPHGCGEGSIGKVVVSTLGSGNFKDTVFNERRAPYFSFGDREGGLFINGRKRRTNDFTIVAEIYNKAGEVIYEDSIEFSMGSFSCLSCASTEIELRDLLRQAPPGSTVSICGDTTIETTSPLRSYVNSLTLACDGENCVISSTNENSNLVVTGSDFVVEGISFLNGVGGQEAGNLHLWADGNHRISDCQFIGATGGYRGSLDVYTSSGGGSVTIENSLFQDNGVKGADISGFDYITIIGSTFDGNMGGTAGGNIQIEARPLRTQVPGGVSVTIKDSSFTNGSAGYHGAGAYIGRFDDISPSKTVSLPTTPESWAWAAGSISKTKFQKYDDSPKSLTIKDSRFVANSNKAGGGLYYQVRGDSWQASYVNTVSFNLLNNVFDDNAATEMGGALTAPGIYHRPDILDTFYQLTMEGNTAAGNTAGTSCDEFYAQNRKGGEYQCVSLEDDDYGS